MSDENNNQIKAPKKKKGFFKHLGFTEKFMFISFSIFTVGIITAVPLYTYVFNKTCKVTFDVYGDSSKLITQEVKKNEVVKKIDDPSKEGYAFLGWRKDKEKSEYYNFSTKVTSDFTLYGTFGKEFKVTFDLNYEGAEPFNKTVVDGNTIGTIDTPTRNKYVFLSWCTDKEGKNKFDLKTPITSDITLYAHWRDVYKYTITFDLNYDGAPKMDTQIVEEGSKITKPSEELTRTYYKFGNWYKEKTCENLYDFDTVMSGETKEITLYAKWDPIIYTATYYSNANGKDYSVWATREIQMPSKRTFDDIGDEGYPHYNFDGWHTMNEKGELEKYDFTKEATGDIKFYSKYSRIVCNVTLDYNYDSKTEIKQVNHGEYLEVNDPSRTGYKFLGWYDDDIFGTKIDFKTTPIETKDVTYYAHWEKLSLVSIDVNAKTSTFAINTNIESSNFVVTASFSDGTSKEISYYNEVESKDGYKIKHNDSSFELPHTCLSGEIKNDIELIFEYTFEDITETYTIRIDIVPAKFNVTPVSKDLTPDYNALNINYRETYNSIDSRTNLFNLEGFGSDYTEITNLELVCKSDLTGEEVSILKGTLKPEWSSSYLLDLSFNNANEFYGGVTVTLRHKTGDVVDKVGSIKLEVGCFSGFKFTANEDDETTCSMIIDTSYESYNSYDFITPSKYYYNTQDKKCGFMKVNKYLSLDQTSSKKYYNFFKTINLTDNIVSIGESSFSHQNNLTKAIISKNINRIPNKAFINCENLEDLEIKNGVKYIGENAFKGCSSIKAVNIPDSVIELESACFYAIGANAKNGASISLSSTSNLEKIDELALADSTWKSLTLNLPSTLTFIGKRAFKNSYSINLKFLFAEDCRSDWKIYNNEELIRAIEESEIDTIDKTTTLLIDNYNYSFQREV